MNEMFPSNYLKGEDLKDRPKGVRVVIESGKLEEMSDGGYKPVLYFRGTKKGLVLNKTNGDTIAEVYGDDTDGWMGKPVIVYFDKSITFAGKKTGGLRVRIPDGIATQSPPSDEPPPPEEEPVFDDSEEVL